MNEDFIANIRFKYKTAFFNYKKAKAKWRSVFETVDKIVIKPIVYDADILRENKQKNRDKSISLDKSVSEIDIALKPIGNSSNA